MSEADWPYVLLALRIVVCVALYLFLIAAFRTLRAELRRDSMAAEDEAVVAEAERVTQETAAVPAAAVYAGRAAGRSATALADEPVQADVADERAASGGHGVRRAPRLRARNAIIAVTPLLILGGAAVVAAVERDQTTTNAPPASANASATPAPHVPGRVTVGLSAQEDSGLRVTVDNVVQFNGVLRAGQRQRWDGASRIQVWTDKGKTLLLSVNGHELGPYSPAMGHADWNRIDFAFGPEWRP
jgi:hypothetical protein